jgi:hypothetical protein
MQEQIETSSGTAPRSLSVYHKSTATMVASTMVCAIRGYTGGARLVSYYDGNLGGDIDTRKSTSSTLFFPGRQSINKAKGGGFISSCEAEYVTYQLLQLKH